MPSLGRSSEGNLFDPGREQLSSFLCNILNHATKLLHCLSVFLLSPTLAEVFIEWCVMASECFVVVEHVASLRSCPDVCRSQSPHLSTNCRFLVSFAIRASSYHVLFHLSMCALYAIVCVSKEIISHYQYTFTILAKQNVVPVRIRTGALNVTKRTEFQLSKTLRISSTQSTPYQTAHMHKNTTNTTSTHLAPSSHSQIRSASAARDSVLIGLHRVRDAAPMESDFHQLRGRLHGKPG